MPISVPKTSTTADLSQEMNMEANQTALEMWIRATLDQNYYNYS